MLGKTVFKNYHIGRYVTQCGVDLDNVDILFT